MDPVVQGLLSHGLPGIVILCMGWWIIRQDSALRAETRARIDDAKAGSAVALQLQAQVIDAVNKCAMILDEVKHSARRNA